MTDAERLWTLRADDDTGKAVVVLTDAEAHDLLSKVDRVRALEAERDRLMDTVAGMVERERFDEVCQRCVQAEAQIAALRAERRQAVTHETYQRERARAEAASARADAAEAALRTLQQPRVDPR
jgi:multidrug resistance efflux pump